MIDPLETSGFPPTTTSRSVRSRSGTGSSSGEPNSRYESRCCGCWSTLAAEYRFRVPSACSSIGINVTGAQPWVMGLPR